MHFSRTLKYIIALLLILSCPWERHFIITYYLTLTATFPGMKGTCWQICTCYNMSRCDSSPFRGRVQENGKSLCHTAWYRTQIKIFIKGKGGGYFLLDASAEKSWELLMFVNVTRRSGLETDVLWLYSHCDALTEAVLCLPKFSLGESNSGGLELSWQIPTVTEEGMRARVQGLPASVTLARNCPFVTSCSRNHMASRPHPSWSGEVSMMEIWIQQGVEGKCFSSSRTS